MTCTSFDQALLAQLRMSARERARKDKSKTYLQWLDELCSSYGFAYTALKRRVEEIEAEAEAESLRVEDRLWHERLAASRVWGAIPDPATQSLPLPIDDDACVPWPAQFIECRLFLLTESGPRKTHTGPVFRLDGRDMNYDGEELRISPDQTLLMGFISMSRGLRCGEVVACSLAELERRMGGSLLEFGLPVSYVEIERTLWRLANCRLAFPDVGFGGQILAYADARHAPQSFSFAFNPKFANFYYPFLAFVDGLFE